MSGTGEQTGPRSRKGTQTRARLVDAARDVFAEQGFLEARISEIAERAGLGSHGAFYHYFSSKEQIFREVAEVVDERVSVGLAAMHEPSSEGTPYDHLRSAIRSYFRLYKEHAQVMGVIEQVARCDGDVGRARIERLKRYSAEIATSMRELQRRGLADQVVDADVAAVALGQMTASFAELWLVRGAVHIGVDDAVDQIASLFAKAIGMAQDTAAPQRRAAASRRKVE